MEFRDSTGQVIRTRSTPLFTTPQAEGAGMKTLKDIGYETIAVDMRREFSCKCGGVIKIISEDKVLHSCRNKYNPSETYYTGEDVMNYVEGEATWDKKGRCFTFRIRKVKEQE